MTRYLSLLFIKHLQTIFVDVEGLRNVEYIFRFDATGRRETAGLVMHSEFADVVDVAHLCLQLPSFR